MNKKKRTKKKGITVLHFSTQARRSKGGNHRPVPVHVMLLTTSPTMSRRFVLPLFAELNTATSSGVGHATEH